jgi:Uma2 family endonuclease
MVTCDPRDTEPLFKSFPKLIIEVLSDSTDRHDRTEKFWNYTQVETLEEYVLVAHDRVTATIFRRANGWKAEVWDQPTAEIIFASVGLKMLLSEVYEGIPLKATYFLDTSFAKPA